MLRHALPMLRRGLFLTGAYDEELGVKDVSWLTPAATEMTQGVERKLRATPNSFGARHAQRGVSISYCSSAVEARAADAGAHDENVAARVPDKAPLRHARQRASLPD
jgi:hypothetical protein